MRAGNVLAFGAILSLAIAVSGCAFVSRDGPATGEVIKNAEVTLANPGYELSYALVELSPLSVDLFAATPKRFAAFSRASAATRPAEVRISAGDTVVVTIFEAAGGGLFLPEGSRAGNVTIPPQEVDRAGNITIPYAGSIRALGRTTAELQGEIEQRLKERAIEPQVIVTIPERRSNDITVLGEVRNPTRFPADPAGTRLLNALARAGGTRNPDFESIVTVQRRGRTEHALMTAVITNPTQNINIVPGDVVYVSREPRVFLAFGATASNAVGLVGSNNRRFVFEEENLTVADGVAKAGGLLDTRADSTAVFVFRKVPRAMLERAGVDVSKFSETLVPTIFRLDFSKAEGLFLANSFYMQDKDMIYVSNSPAEDLAKFVAVINDIGSAVSQVSSTVGEFRNFGSATSRQ
jgi:polysaccharide export outer membrane protein